MGTTVKVLATPRAPAGLSAASRRLWRELHEQYDLRDPFAMHWLTVACQANDVMLLAAKELAGQGVTLPASRDRGRVRHPAMLAWRDAAATMATAFRMLNLGLPGEE